MFRFDKEEMKKIMEVADLFKAIKDDKLLKNLAYDNVEVGAFMTALIDVIPVLYTVMDSYDNYLRDEAVKAYVNTNGFNRNEKREFNF